MMLLGAVVGNALAFAAIVIALFILGLIVLIVKWYRKPIHGRAIVRTGAGGTKVAFEKGMFVIPVFHRMEIMDITLKTITISRLGVDGLICRDNMRADIKVAFFVRVNNTFTDTKNVALSIGCKRASQKETLENLFDSKFSEALKTVGKKFNFVDLYNSRKEFKEGIVGIIGKDLNGYILDDCAIDYLEQTSIKSLKNDNILDSEGIKKIIKLTAEQQILANKIKNEREKTIKQQDVSARETILEYEKQLAEKEQKQRREIENIKDIEQAEITKISEEQRLIAEQARISAEESIQIAEQNKQRQILVATWNKERINAIEQEKVEKERSLQINERERIVTLAQIEKEKAVEVEKADIQKIIRDRVMVEKDVVVEQEKIKDTEAYASADRKKQVAITTAEMLAEQELVRQIKSAEANRKSTEINSEAEKIAEEFAAQRRIIEANASFAAAGKEAEATKILAEAEAAKASAKGKAEAQVIEAKAIANLKDGESIAKVFEMDALAEAKAIEAKSTAKAKEIQEITTAEADALNKKGEAEANIKKAMGISEADALNKKGEAEANILKQKGEAEASILKQKGLSEASVIDAKAEAEKKKGLAEAAVISEKYAADAQGIEKKAEAMKKLDGVGKQHEEFKLQLNKDKEIELAQINIWKDIANAQAKVIGEAVKSAKIDIVGGETMFFEKIIGAFSYGKTLDTFVNKSSVLNSVKEKFIPTVEKNNIVEENIEDIEENNEIIDETVETGDNENLESNSEPVDKKSSVMDDIKEIVLKYAFMVDGFKDMRISTLLKKYVERMTDRKMRNYIKDLIKLAEEHGIDNLIVKTLNVNN